MVAEGMDVVITESIKGGDDYQGVQAGEVGYLSELGSNGIAFVAFESGDFAVPVTTLLPFHEWEDNPDADGYTEIRSWSGNYEIQLFDKEGSTWPDFSLYVWHFNEKEESFCDEMGQIHHSGIALYQRYEPLVLNLFFARAWAAWERGLSRPT